MTGDREEGGDPGEVVATTAGVEEEAAAAMEEESGVTKPTWRTFGPITGRLGRLRSIKGLHFAGFTKERLTKDSLFFNFFY